jgi:DNA-binding transcriptional MocR family regulator
MVEVSKHYPKSKLPIIYERSNVNERAALRSSPLYEQLADELAAQISTGVFGPGDKLPSVRQVSQNKGVSVTTVLQAYQLLEDRGSIEARPQSGYYVRFIPLPSLTVPEPGFFTPPDDLEEAQIDDLVMMVMRDSTNLELIQLGAAQPDPSLLPTDRMNRILSRLARLNDIHQNMRGLPEGCIELRTQVAKRAFLLGCSIAPEDLLITSGCTEAVSLALRAVCQPGDLVAIESPTYFGILQAIETQGLRPLEIPTHQRDGINLEALDFAIEHYPVKAVVVMSNYHNPLGSCMPEENKRALVDLLAPREIPLIEDDIHGELSFSDQRPLVAKSFDQNGLVLLCSSFSKDISPSYRVGWIAPGRFFTAVQKHKMATTLSTPILLQHVIAEFLDNGGYDHHLRKIRRAYAQKVTQTVHGVLRSFPKGTQISSPEGGYLLWVQLPRQVDSLALYREALQVGITLAPGYIFSSTPKFHNYIRLNTAYMSFAAEKALDILGGIVQKMAKA